MNAIQCAAFLSGTALCFDHLFYIRAQALHKGFLRQQVLLADEKLKADQKNILIDGFLLVSLANTSYSNSIV